MDISLKVQAHEACIQHLYETINRLEAAVSHAQQAASDDTKSSAGDKFETSREMMKLEINKLNEQLRLASTQLGHLQRLDPTSQQEEVAFGSLVRTKEGLYYFSVGLGKIAIEGAHIFALTMASPIGRALAGKRKGDEVNFMNRTISVQDLV